MKTRVTVLSENSVVKPMGLIGEHGFAALVERGDSKVLFDTGQGYALVHNARILGVDLGTVDTVVLSHGHYDHTGGLAELLKGGGRKRIFAHPGIFVSRYWEAVDGSREPIGMPFTRAYLEGLGADFVLSETSQVVAEGISTTGEVARETVFEKGDTTLFLCEENGGGPDPHVDDLSLVVEGESGLLVLLGCAHAGLVNILRHVQKTRPGMVVKAVVGGTHLGFSGEEQMQGTVEAMTGMGVEKVGASHCTGLAGSARLREALGDSFFFAGVGSVLEV
ncbi:MAG: MBL fold metallo-hydrolase [bacterium]|nr:MBL fold metallo-hydrolase [bacterium]MDT8396291.1 MBL fold metallo-hydrolase [bacterium]